MIEAALRRMAALNNSASQYDSGGVFFCPSLPLDKEARYVEVTVG